MISNNFPIEFIYFSPLFLLLNRNILDKKYEETKKINNELRNKES